MHFAYWEDYFGEKLSIFKYKNKTGGFTQKWKRKNKIITQY